MRTAAIGPLREFLEETYLIAKGLREQWTARYEERRLHETRIQLAVLRGLRELRQNIGSITSLITAGRSAHAAGSDARVKIEALLALRFGDHPKELAAKIAGEVAGIVPEAVQSAAATTGVTQKQAVPYPNLRSVHAEMTVELQREVSERLEASFTAYSGDLAQTIVAATDPRHPRTMAQLSGELNNEFLGIDARRARMIARTESARVYGASTYETYRTMGAKRYRWVTAAGSPIAATSPVCVYCQELASQGNQDLEDGFSSEITVGVRAPKIATVEAKHPPYHPNCRCDIAMDTEDWLPPQEMFDDEILEFTTPEARRRFMEEQTDFITYLRPVTQKTREAAVSYSENSRFWNRYLRADDFGSLGRKGYNPAHVLEMDDFLTNTALKQDIVTWRGGSIPGLGADSGVGLEFTDLGYTATTLERQVAKGFIDQADEVMIKVVLREGQPASPVGFLISGGGFTGEFEVVLPRGLTYRVMADEVISGARTLTLEIV